MSRTPCTRRVACGTHPTFRSFDGAGVMGRLCRNEAVALVATTLVLAITFSPCAGKEEAKSTKKAKRKECSRLGFNMTSLVCTKCDDMETFFQGQTIDDQAKYEDLVADCRGCCSEQVASKKKTHSLAKLQVCD